MLNKKGTLMNWGTSGYGIVSVRSPEGAVENYFLHVAEIVFCKPEAISPGNVVKFETDLTHLPGRLPTCKLAKIYAAEKSTNPVVTTVSDTLAQPVRE